MSNYLHKHLAQPVPQSEPLSSKQVKNNAGGYVFQVDPWQHLQRFLILGSEGGTYYAKERKHTQQNLDNVRACLALDGMRFVDQVVEVSVSARAPKNEPALLCLALAASCDDVEVRRYALANLSQVARIGTHLFHFVAFATELRGWGRTLKRAIQRWYTEKTPDDLAYQLIKYQQRDGWSHRDLLRLSKPKVYTAAMNACFSHTVGKIGGDYLPRQIIAANALMSANVPSGAAKLIREYRLPRECVPTELLNTPEVWAALAETGGMQMLLRNLATMTRAGYVAPLSEGTKLVCERLANEETLHKSRIHPIQVLAALRTYAQGHGERSKQTWTPVQPIVDALNEAFYASFKNVEPTSKNFYLGVDVSGSMTCGDIAGIPGLTPREGAAALSLVIANTEPWCHIAGFSHTLVDLPISPKMRLDDVGKVMDRLPFGRTDCAQPMLDALKRSMKVDVFVVITDNETWAGTVHPVKALQQYRAKTGINAKLIVIGMTSTGFTIADPNDAGMLDIVGFDAAIPALMREFVLS